MLVRAGSVLVCCEKVIKKSGASVTQGGGGVIQTAADCFQIAEDIHAASCTQFPFR